jgi:hypothetical protein
MFELSIFCVILLALGYWMALWLMGRHDDVLHGDFVQAEARPEIPAVPPPMAHAGSTDSLQSLLAVIKQDLKDAARQ